MLTRRTCAAALIAAASPASAQIDAYVLRAEDVACLRAHAATYRAIEGDPVFVAVAQCPQTPRSPLLGALTAEGPDLKLDADAGYDDFVYLTRAQLDCLLTAPAPEGAALLTFRPEACALEPLR